MVSKRLLLGNDLTEDERVDAVLRWLAEVWGWDEDERRRAGLGDDEHDVSRQVDTEKRQGDVV